MYAWAKGLPLLMGSLDSTSCKIKREGIGILLQHLTCFFRSTSSSTEPSTMWMSLGVHNSTCALAHRRTPWGSESQSP